MLEYLDYIRNAETFDGMFNHFGTILAGDGQMDKETDADLQ